MKKTLLTIALTLFTLVGFAQTDIDGKLSVTTQMFLDELKGEIKFNPSTSSSRQGQLHHNLHSSLPDRFYASPDTIDGKVYISCFVRLQDIDNTADLEALGVQVQNKFIKGLITALIPIDKIEEVAAIANVSRINVSPLMRPFTDAARTKTNVDDVLTYSDDARAAGLSQGYDGTGVLLAVIDDGVDFQHIAFKDKNGNSRIKRAYVYNGSSAKEYTSITSSSPTTDDNASDHGTHTSTTAGGSSVIVSGKNVTVTDDHASATYGGMAPGADLYLAGIKDLKSTYLSNAFKKIIAYADANNQPVVVSNSWGSQYGPHDGTGDFADVTTSLFGSDQPNRICLFAASNDGGSSKDGEGGGYFVSHTASSSNPLRTILRGSAYSDANGSYYNSIIANVWCRSTSVSSIGCKIHVLNAHTGKLLKTVSVTPSTNGATVSGLSEYFSGKLVVYKDYITSNKTQLLIYAESLYPTEETTTTVDGSTYYIGGYTLAVELYPTSGTAIIDAWGGNGGYFTNYLTTEGYNWQAGTDDMSVSDEATYPNVISVGAYVSKNRITNYSGTTYNYSDEYTMDDIAYFSSYATAAASPDGKQYPWITAPGARIVAGVNHYSTDYTSGDYKTDRVNTNTTYPYAAMEGTSMATPTAAGIVALWMQAAKKEGKDITLDYIKEVMRETAINDYYTTSGPNASHFGNGKIDALAGIKYILGVTDEPTIKATPTNLSFEGYATMTYTKTMNVKGVKLDDNITATLTDANHVYAIDKSNITVAEAVNGVDITVTWSPTAAGQTTATLTLSSAGAETVTVNLTGIAEAATPVIMADKTELNFNGNINQDCTGQFQVSGRFLDEDVEVALTDNNHVFSVNLSSIEAASLNDDGKVMVTVTFNAAQEGSYTGKVTLSSAGVIPVTINLSATASDGGTAEDSYLNIAKYNTIDEAGWNSTYVNKLYAYTENTDENYGWLTMPVYGAWVGVYYDNHPQTWIESSVGTSFKIGKSTYSTYNGVTWNASAPLLGSSIYFNKQSDDGRARAMGVNSGNNTKLVSVAFYVTNTTEVKLYGLGRNGVSSTYPAYIKVYECSRNADGSVTASSSALKTETNTSTSTTTPFTITVSDLNASNIYKVEVGNYRGYLYEVAFKTPLTVTPPVLKGDINRDGIVDLYDVTALIDIVLDGDTEAPYTFPQYDHVAADVNEDNSIDIYDVTMLIDIILNEE